MIYYTNHFEFPNRKRMDFPRQSFKSLFNKDRSKLDNDICRRIVQEIDNTIMIDVDCYKSPVLGMIPVDRLSTGCKVLLSLYLQQELIPKDKHPAVWSRFIGNNCGELLLWLGSQYDIYLIVTTTKLRFRDNILSKYPNVLFNIDIGKYITNDYEFFSLNAHAFAAYSEYIEMAERNIVEDDE